MSVGSNIQWLNEMIKAQILRFLPKQGRLETAIPGFALTRYDNETSPEHCLCGPMAAYVAAGNKRSFYGETETCYGAGQCVALGIHTPAIFQIANASRDKPFLSLSIKLDASIISQLLCDFPMLAAKSPITISPVGVMNIDFELLDAFRRLAALLDYPERIPLFAPLVIREIHFLILTGNLGSQLRLFNASGPKTYQIRGAINWLRDNFKTDLKIPELAKKARMAPSTFNRHFKMATGLSPLQFQKHLRLHEAERLMLVENHDAGTAALAVGYGSGSQFTREYKRLFGAPPRQNISSKLAS